MDNRPTIAEVQEWVLKLYNTCEQTITSEERKEQHKYEGVSKCAPSFFMHKAPTFTSRGFVIT